MTTSTASSDPSETTNIIPNGVPPQGDSDPDYSQFLFVEEKGVLHTDFTSQITLLGTREKSERNVPLSSVSVKVDGSINIGNTNYRSTKWAFEQLCKKLGIPRPFARKIPPDLLLDNITRLIQEKVTGEDEQVMFHILKQDTAEIIIGCTKSDYMFVETADFLIAAAAMIGNGYSYGDLYVGDRLTEVDVLLDSGKITTPHGDTYQVGINLRSSDCGDVNPTARLYVWDDKKSCAYILSTEWGRVDRIRNKKVNIETSFTNFMGHVSEMIIATPQLTSALEKMHTTDATDVELKNWFDTFNRAIADNKPAIDNLLGMDEESRKNIFKQISFRKKSNAINRLQGVPIVQDQSSGKTKRELSALVGGYAKDATFEERDALRRLAGSFLTLE